MLKKKYNALILDDNEFVGDNIRKRIYKANTSNYSYSGVEIIPHFLTIDISDLSKAAKSIINYINANKIDYLLLDRGFYFVIDPSSNETYNNLDNKYIYTKKKDLKNGVKIEKILELTSKKEYNRIKGIIVYTYDANEDYIEPAQIRQTFLNIMPENFNEKNIEIILTNSEVYKLSGLNLYIDSELPENKEMTITGLKSDFKLYGLFMGEILYHRMISMLNKEQERRFISKQKMIIRNFIILFFTFTFLSIGGNASYQMLYNKIHSNIFLLVISVVFAVLLPLFILAVKPNLLINIEDE